MQWTTSKLKRLGTWFIISVYDKNARTLFDSGATYSSVASQFACNLQQSLELLPYILMVTTPIGKRVACENYYPQCSVLISELQMPVDTIVLACMILI